ncbi:MAG: type II toxin-antitoxin system RelE/ParE family toxin [Pseudomonadota bacterium]
MSRKYKIFETKRFSNDLQLLARHRKTILEEKMQEYVYPQLKKEPHFGANIKRLRDWHPPTWRYRVGEWRFFYIIDEELKVISMISASHRKSAYRKKR